MRGVVKVALKLQAYLTELLGQQGSTFAMHYKAALKRRIKKLRPVFQAKVEELAAGVQDRESVFAEYESVFSSKDRKDREIDKIYENIERRVYKLRKGTRSRLRSVFSKQESFGEALDLHCIHTDAKGCFQRYFFTKALVDYLEAFLAKSKHPRSPSIKVDAEDVLGMEGLMKSVYCTFCCRTISTNVSKYHLMGKGHAARKTKALKGGLLDRRSGSEGDGLVSVDREEVLVLTSELATLAVSLRNVEFKGLEEVQKRALFDIESLFGERAARPTISSGLSKAPLQAKRPHRDVLLFCEICNTEVTCENTFKRHFESREHAQALVRRGGNDSKRFFGVSKISVLGALMSSIEEEEDQEGNIYDKKTYEDLEKHGLV